EPHEMRRHTLDGFVVAAREVANFWPFDLDHAGAEVRKLARSKRSGHRMFQSNYRNAIEGSHTIAVNAISGSYFRSYGLSNKPLPNQLGAKRCATLDRDFTAA